MPRPRGPGMKRSNPGPDGPVAPGTVVAMNDVSLGSRDHVRIGVLGCGHVGAALTSLVAERRAEVARRHGLDLEVTRIAVRNTAIDRDVPVDDGAFTTDASSVVADPEVDVVVEVMGGIEPARELVMAALSAGKPVVTANKELLANHGAELYALAADNGVDLLFEAAVAGAIPIMRPLRESLAGEPIERVMGIVNGTTNFILSRMTDDGASYADALAEAQSLGTPSVTRRPMSRATTPGPRRPSWPPLPSGPGWWPATSTTRASRTSRWPTSSLPPT